LRKAAMDGTVAAEGETGWALEDLEGFSGLKRSCEGMNEAAFSYRSGSIGNCSFRVQRARRVHLMEEDQ